MSQCLRTYLPKSQQGTTLIEVLVAMIVLGVGLLGTAALMTRAQHVQLDSYERSYALILAQDMINRISGNRRASGCYNTFVTTPNYVGTDNDPVSCSGWGTSATRSRADADLNEWTALLNSDAEKLNGSGVGAMTGARGCIQHDQTNNIFTVTVAWQGHTQTVAPAGNTCAENEFGAEDLRRVVSLTLKLGRLD